MTNIVEGKGNWPIISPIYYMDEAIGWNFRESRFKDVWFRASNLFFHILFNSCPWYDECHVDGWRGFLV